MHLPVIFFFLFKERRTYWKNKQEHNRIYWENVPYREGINFREDKISLILVDFVKIKSCENHWKYWRYCQNASFSPHSLSLHPTTTLCHLIHYHFSLPLSPTKVCDWSILDILTKYSFIFPHLPTLCDFDAFWVYQ